VSFVFFAHANKPDTHPLRTSRALQAFFPARGRKEVLPVPVRDLPLRGAGRWVAAPTRAYFDLAS